MKNLNRRLVAILPFLVGGFMAAEAQIISDQQAVFRAAEQLECDASAMVLAYTATDPLTGEPAYYAFNREGGGFAIVAADERVSPVVLGYNGYGAYDHASLTDAAREWMDSYITVVNSARKAPARTVSQRRAARQAAPTAGVPAAVKPLIGNKQYLNTEWEGYMPWTQYAPFNDYCPTKNNQKCAVGCVAMSMAMVMSAHQWPDRGVGSISYGWNGQTLTNSFEHNYDWSLLKYRYWTNGVETDYTPAEGHFIATLLRDCGYAVRMNYGSGYEGSGAAEENACKALVQNFKYDKGVSYLCRDYCTKQYWEDLLRSEIAAGRPVMYGGGSRYGAHEFTCDGYDAEGRFFFHMGGTAIDGYYATNNVSGGYNTSQTIVYNIKPAKNGAAGQATMVAGSNKDFLWTGSSNITSNVRFFTPVEQFDAEVAVAVENAANHSVQYVNVQSVKTSNTNNQGTTVNSFQVTGNYADGTYYVYPVYRKKGAAGWEKVLFGQFCQDRVTLSVKNGVKTFSNNDLKEDIDESKTKVDGIVYIIDESSRTAAVTYQNSGFNSYSGNVTIPATFNYNNKTYTVTSIADEAFSECDNVGNVTIPATVKSIGYGAFYKCKGKSITFAAGSQLKSIDSYAFAYSGFPSFNLPEGLTNIGGEAFVGCSMTSFVLPSTVAKIGTGVFSACASIKSFTVKHNKPNFWSLENDPFPNIYDFSQMTLYIPVGSRAYYLMNPINQRFGNMVEGTAPAPDTNGAQGTENTEDDNGPIPGTYSIKLAGSNLYLTTDGSNSCLLSNKPEYFYVEATNGGYTITSATTNFKLGYGKYYTQTFTNEASVWNVENINGSNTRILRKGLNYGIYAEDAYNAEAIYTNRDTKLNSSNCYWVFEKVPAANRVQYIGEGVIADIDASPVETMREKQIFDLQGRRVSSPQHGHIYLIDGKKTRY